MAKVIDKSGTDTIKIRFTRNTAWQGTDYGPDYKKAEAEIPAWQAKLFIAKGRAVEVTAKAAKPETAEESPAGDA